MENMSRIMLFIFCGVSLLVAGCDEHIAVPKPRAYPRVVYPEKAYKPFDASYCDFTFEMPVYAKTERDTSFFGEKPAQECWFNLTVPDLNATIYCSYYRIANRVALDTLIQDAFTMTQKHNIKASFIEEIPISRPAARVHGMLFNVEGPAASSYQFFLTDSTHHFLRGALYFNSQSRPDSLAPVVDFMKKDVNKLIETLNWRK
jgi:gliding motility-associated lipoprotein GldD